jgi:hypothetical protein
MQNKTGRPKGLRDLCGRPFFAATVATEPGRSALTDDI